MLSLGRRGSQLIGNIRVVHPDSSNQDPDPAFHVNPVPDKDPIPDTDPVPNPDPGFL